MIDLMITDSEAVPGTALCCTWYCTVCDAWCSTVAHKLAIAEPRENTFSLPTPIINESLHFCNESPCTWLVLGDSVVSTMYEALEQYPNTPNNAAQKMAYRNYMLVKLGQLGAGNWRDPPNCEKHGIHNEWPETDGHYMGFHSGPASAICTEHDNKFSSNNKVALFCQLPLVQGIKWDAAVTVTIKAACVQLEEACQATHQVVLPVDVTEARIMQGGACDSFKY